MYVDNLNVINVVWFISLYMCVYYFYVCIDEFVWELKICIHNFHRILYKEIQALSLRYIILHSKRDDSYSWPCILLSNAMHCYHPRACPGYRYAYHQCDADAIYVPRLSAGCYFSQEDLFWEGKGVCSLRYKMLNWLMSKTYKERGMQLENYPPVWDDKFTGGNIQTWDEEACLNWCRTN